jgi:hypothetical protein
MIILRNQLVKSGVFNVFCSSKSKRRKLTRNISLMLLAFSDEIETLRATDPKADLGPIYQNYDFKICAGERSTRYATAEATKDIVISV